MQPRTLSNDEVSAQVLRSRQMLAQTQAQGDTPFAGSSYDVPQRTIQGTPSSIAVPGNEQTQQQISPDFNTQLIGLLKQYQTMGTKPFQEKAISGQQEQVQRQQTTPQDMIGASPSQQGAVRDASVSAVQPTVEGAQQQGKTFGEQLNSFGNTVKTVQDLFKEQHAQQDKERDDARNIVQNAFTTFGSKATEILDPKIFKQAGYEASVLTNIKDTLKEKEMAQKFQNDEANRLQRESIAAMKAQGKNGADSKSTEYGLGKAEQGISLAKEALGHVNNWTTGVGGILKWLPNTDSRTLGNIITALKANIGFNELQAMRAASPTGGALGQVAVQELEGLQATLGSLDQFQDPAELRQNLIGIQTHFQNWKNTLSGNTQNTPQTVQMTGPQGTFNVPQDKVETFKQNGYTTGDDNTSW